MDCLGYNVHLQLDSEGLPGSGLIPSIPETNMKPTSRLFNEDFVLHSLNVLTERFSLVVDFLEL